MNLNSYIDHTLLKPTATPNDIEKLCNEAKTFKFYAVCVNGCYVSLAVANLKNSDVKIAAVVGFPLGAMSSESKIAEAKFCVSSGAHEIDMVLNIGLLKSGDSLAVEKEISAIKKAIGKTVLKVIIETCYLTDKEKVSACNAALNAGADFVKTSTGFGPGGATLEDLQLMKEAVGEKVKIKASGGIKDRETALIYINAGAQRIGTSSGIAIVT